MIVIFDLDYTIFDAKRFRAECLAPFFGMRPAEFENYYKVNFKDKQIHFDALEMLGRFELTEEELDRALERQISSFLFPETDKIIKKFKDAGTKLVMLTFGNKAWQARKIKYLKLGEESLGSLFDQIIFADKSKAESAELGVLGDGRIVIINDNAKESQALMRLFEKRAKSYLLEGPYSYNINHKERVYKLSDLLTIDL